MHLRGATYNINMIAQLLPAAMKAGVLRAPSMAATNLLPLVSGTDVAAAADAVLKDFGAYAGQVCLSRNRCAPSVSHKQMQCIRCSQLHHAGTCAHLWL